MSRVQITQAFSEGFGEALNPGYVLENIPEAKAQEWVGLGRAIILPDVTPTLRRHAVETPSARPRRVETAVVKKARR